MESIKKRPVFLTILCIISYVLLGWAMFGALIGLILAPVFKPIHSTMNESMQEASEELANKAPGMSEVFESIMKGSGQVMEYMTELNIVNLICSGIALWGVIMMWKLKKTGFYLYAAGRLIMAIFPLILIGDNFITGISSVIGIFFVGVMLVLYGLNLKAME